MAVYSRKSIAAFTSGLVVAGYICLGIVFLMIAATVVLSLIPIYTPNHSVEAYGEQYRIKTMMIKASYQNISTTFDSGTIADSLALSTSCGSTYRKEGVKNFAGCVATNFYVFNTSAANSSSGHRRRKAVPLVVLYEIGEINLYYSTSCPQKSDRSKYVNSTSLSYCVKSRLIDCNNLVNSSAQGNVWSLPSDSLIQMIMSENSPDYQSIIVESVSAIPFANASVLISNSTLNHTLINDFQLGCQYIGPLSQTQIAEALNSQLTTTSLPPTSTGPSF